MNRTLKLIECPRDAMQGWPHFIPTAQKVEYINALLKVGFDTIDFGSFVSPKALPQMKDTQAVLSKLETENTATKLLAIIANLRGAEEACQFEKISYLGFPFSISETFQQRNTNKSITQAFEEVKRIQEICVQKNKKLVIYLSMAFGNPYGDPYSEAIVFDYAHQMIEEDIQIISLADTVGKATPDGIKRCMYFLVNERPDIEWGVHLHSTAENWREKLEAAYNAGCRRFDGALKGIGGCPMAGNTMVGNMNSEWMLSFFEEKGETVSIDKKALEKSIQLANQVFVS